MTEYTFENGQTLKESPSEISVTKLSLAYQALIAARKFVNKAYCGDFEDDDVDNTIALIDEALKDAV